MGTYGIGPLRYRRWVLIPGLGLMHALSGIGISLCLLVSLDAISFIMGAYPPSPYPAFYLFTLPRFPFFSAPRVERWTSVVRIFR